MVQELADLKQAAYGTTADKIRYFDNCVRRRLQEMDTAEPTQGNPLTWEQKRKLSVACSQLNESHCYALVDILAKHSGKDTTGDGEVLVDIGSLPDPALHAIQVSVASDARQRCVLLACCLRVACVLLACCLRVACVLLACCLRVACVLLCAWHLGMPSATRSLLHSDASTYTLHDLCRS
jgi:hypothetical protein